MSQQPTLGKRPPDPRDYTPIQWLDFLKVKHAAQIAADRIGYPVYLVGSALYKAVPRDIDIGVRIPEVDYVSMFGPIPGDRAELNNYFYNVWSKTFDSLIPLYHCLITTHYLDVKVVPDTWWADRDQLCLAMPRKQSVKESEES